MSKCTCRIQMPGWGDKDSEPTIARCNFCKQNEEIAEAAREAELCYANWSNNPIGDPDFPAARKLRELVLASMPATKSEENSNV